MSQVYWLHLIEHCDPKKEGYIGVSNNIDNRIKHHMRSLKNGKHENIHLTHAYLRYGIRIISSVIYEGDEQKCYIKEAELRPEKAMGWNIAEGGRKPPDLTGIPKSEEHRANMRGPKSEETKTNMRGPKSEEHRANMSKALQGNTRRLGKPWSEEHKQKLRKPKLEEHRANMKSPKSEEHKKNMKNAWTPERRKAQSERMEKKGT